MIELGLQRISRLLSKTHIPWRAIHVAGTNGKGSICVYISGMLEAYNNSNFRKLSKQPSIRHGRFTSPHLIDRWDCISINQKTVSSALFHEIEKKVLLRNTNEEINASEFELLTATAFEIFTHENVDIGVIEVGMGGRLDATNILGVPVEGDDTITRALPLATAIAKIGLDHQSFLGSTLQAIASEKAGILKPGVPLVYDSSNPPEVTETFRKLASQIGAPVPDPDDLIILSPESTQALEETLPASSKTPSNLATDSPTTNPPTHTRHNTSVALQATLLALSQLSPSLSAPLLSKAPGLLPTLLAVPSRTVFPGRLQNLSIQSLTGRTQPIFLDGAHNAQSAAVLAEAVAKLRSPSPESVEEAKVTWLLAASDSKDIHELLRPLLRAGDDFCAVEFGPVDGMPWVKAMSSEKVAEAARAVLGEKGHVAAGDGEDVGSAFGRDVVAGLKRASEIADGGPMVVAGSLYLVGSVLRALRESESESGE
jgi:folylpolyglutamate synthase/dihydrofolate synthase